MKLYEVELKGMQGSYGHSYVLADGMDEAYAKVRNFLKEHEIGYNVDRKLGSIILLADEERLNGESETMLHMRPLDYIPIIKPCPFCGTEPEIGTHNPKVDGKYQYQIGCASGNCPMDYVGGHGFTTEEEAIAAWNKRGGKKL